MLGMIGKPLFQSVIYNIYTVTLGGGFKYFFFHPYLGKIPILTSIFFNGVETTN